MALGAVLAALVYLHQAWARWAIVLWYLVPLVGDFLVLDSANYALSWLFAVQIISVILLFTPESNAWLVGVGNESH